MSRKKVALIAAAGLVAAGGTAAAGAHRADTGRDVAYTNVVESDAQQSRGNSNSNSSDDDD